MERKQGIIFFATEEAKKNYKQKDKKNKSYCPSCEIKIKKVSDKNIITEETLKD